MAKQSSLQLNLFILQPDPLTKEQLFSEEKRKEMQWVLSDEEYNFYKENTRFVSYEELLWKLAQMKDWLNENISDWSKTMILNIGWDNKSNNWIKNHIIYNLNNILYETEMNEIINNTEKINKIILFDDAIYTWLQILDYIRWIDRLYRYWGKVEIVICVPYISFGWLRYITNEHINDNVTLVFPDVVEYLPVWDRDTKKMRYKYEDMKIWNINDTLLIFQHKIWSSIPEKLQKIWDIKPPYKTNFISK